MAFLYDKEAVYIILYPWSLQMRGLTASILEAVYNALRAWEY